MRSHNVFVLINNLMVLKDVLKIGEMGMRTFYEVPKSAADTVSRDRQGWAPSIVRVDFSPSLPPNVHIFSVLPKSKPYEYSTTPSTILFLELPQLRNVLNNEPEKKRSESGKSKRGGRVPKSGFDLGWDQRLGFMIGQERQIA